MKNQNKYNVFESMYGKFETDLIRKKKGKVSEGGYP